MVSFLRKHPFLRLGISLISGVCAAMNCDLLTDSLALIFALLSMASAMFLHHFARGRRWMIISGLSLIMAVFWLGAYRYLSELPTHNSDHFSHALQDQSNHRIYLEIDHIVKQRVMASVSHINGEDVEGHLLLFIADSLIPELRVGDLLYTKLAIYDINGPQNPGGFDFRTYYHSKNIYHQAFLNGSYLRLGKEPNFSLKQGLSDCQEYFSGLLSTHIISADNLALCQALLLGDKSLLPRELKAAFVDAGTMHILAVSGLHLGIIYLMLNFIFSPFKGQRRMSGMLCSAVIILLLWLYAMLVGGSASVIRAATMFSLFEFSRVVFRINYAINSLSLAAFGLVLINPFSVGDVGFQLSFLALLGILICQRPIEHLWIIEHPVWHKIWQMISLSFAAQLFTFPLSIYYFHHFPIYFWLSSLVAIPMAFAMLTLGFMFFTFHWIPVLSWMLATLLNSTSGALNTWIYFVQAFPGVSIEGVSIDYLQMTFLFALAIFVSLLLIEHKRSYVFYALGVVVLFQSYNGFKKYTLATESEFVVYSSSLGPCADLFIGRTVYAVKQPESDSVPFDVSNYRMQRQITDIDQLSDCGKIYAAGGFLKVGDWTCCLVDDVGFRMTDAFPKVDLLWLTTPVDVSDFSVVIANKAGMVLMDRTLPYAFAQRLEGEMEDLGIQTYNMREMGAYIKTIE